MSMYLPNDDLGPTGAEGAEFIDVPVPAPDPERGSDEDATPEAGESHPGRADEAATETDADGSS